MILRRFRLGAIKPGIEAVAVEQFLVRTDLHDLAPFHDDQAVRPAQRAQAVGDGDRRAAANEVVQGQLDLALRLRIDRGSGLVEDQDAGIDQQRPGDADPLPLAAGERLAALADQRIVAVGQAEDELVGRGPPWRRR